MAAGLAKEGGGAGKVAVAAVIDTERGDLGVIPVDMFVGVAEAGRTGIEVPPTPGGGGRLVVKLGGGAPPGGGGKLEAKEAIDAGPSVLKRWRGRGSSVLDCEVGRTFFSLSFFSFPSLVLVGRKVAEFSRTGGIAAVGVAREGGASANTGGGSAEAPPEDLGERPPEEVDERRPPEVGGGGKAAPPRLGGGSSELELESA